MEADYPRFDADRKNGTRTGRGRPDQQLDKRRSAPIASERGSNHYTSFCPEANMALERGTTLGPYEILAAIGAGGMGEVYRARDGRLGRDVAIKVLPAEVSSDENRLRRFALEARAASALNHPNILTIYDIGTHLGAPYLVMELLEGQTLAERLGGVPLSVAQVLDYALQMSRGLAAAHAQGVVHRDVKPQNVFVTTDGRLKILDFGLARQAADLGPVPQADLSTRQFSPGTAAGVVLGTVGYMSPEQAKGEPADARSDIFSFGCVVYEMLSGRRAFAGDSAIETLHAILKDDPPRLARLAPSIPQGLEDAVNRCLEKKPESRFASSADVVLAFQRLSSQPAPESAPSARHDMSLLVLPFSDLSPGKDNEYFSDGLTEEIIGDLSRIGSLRVVSRTTAMALKGTPKSLPTLATELAVRYVLEGSVRRAGNNLRISAQLVDSTTDAHAWSERFSGTLDDVFDIQERVSRAITSALKVRLTASEDRRMAKRPISSIQVYDFFLKAREAIHSYSATGLEEAERLLQKGLELAGENALLLAGLARVHFEHVDFGLEGEEGLADAERFAQRALALDAECAPASLVLGLVHHFRGELAEAVRLLKRALESDPNDTDTLWWLAWFGLWITGQHDEAREAARRQVELDPGNPMSHASVALVDFVEGRIQEALAATEGLPIEFPMFAYVRAMVLTAAGRKSDAVAVLDQIEPAEAFDVGRAYALIIKFAVSGRLDRFPEALRPEFVRLAELDACTAVGLAMAYGIVGEHDTALDWLEKAVPRGYFNYPYLRTHDVFMASMRGQPRFERVMVEIKTRWENFRA
jgi:serine/threonine protein kinase/cytochrome c-type biogenesis protein CcmH/NrfG